MSSPDENKEEECKFDKVGMVISELSSSKEVSNSLHSKKFNFIPQNN